MDLLADPDAVATYVQDYTLNDDAVLQALAFATSLVQAATGQRLIYVEDDEALLPWPNSGHLELPERPVISVSAVEFRGGLGGAVQALQPSQWTMGAGGRLGLAGGYYELPGPWYHGASVAVTYTHGFQVVPADLQSVAVGVAVRTLHKPTESLNESLDDYTQPVSSAGPAMLTPSEQYVCRRYRRTTHSAGWGR